MMTAIILMLLIYVSGVSFYYVKRLNSLKKDIEKSSAEISALNRSLDTFKSDVSKSTQLQDSITEQTINAIRLIKDNLRAQDSLILEIGRKLDIDFKTKEPIKVDKIGDNIS